MRILFVLVSLALVGLLVPAASAQVTVTAAAPSAPLVPGEAVTIPVTFSADCATVLTQYQAAGTTELEIEIKSAPAWLTGVGEAVPFTADMCDPASASVESTGDLVVTASTLAPGLEAFEIVIGPKDDDSAGTVAGTVAFIGTFTLESPGPEFMLDVGGNGTGVFAINYTGNAAGLAMLQVIVEGEYGTIEGLPETIDVPSPLSDNATSRSVPLQFDYKAKSGSNFSMDMITVQVMMHAAEDMNQMGPTQELMFHFMAMDHAGMDHEGTHDHGTHDHATVPSLDVALVALAIVGVAFLARRRA